MAQLYKMTLYVCDLEDSLSLDEIESLINERALNGIAVNCVCHFADRQIGKQVEWDDDIDLNKCNCPTSAWDKYFTPPKKPMTNGEWVRAVSDGELVEFVGHNSLCDRIQGECGNWCNDHNCTECLQKWLQQPAEGE